MTDANRAREIAAMNAELDMMGGPPLLPPTSGKREHTLTVGRFEVTGEFDAIKLDLEDCEWGIHSKDLERLELQAAIAVLSSTAINGDELRFARKAIGLRQPELAVLLDVATDVITRWETGSDPIPYHTQLAVLLFVERTLRNGTPALSPPPPGLRIEPRSSPVLPPK